MNQASTLAPKELPRTARGQRTRQQVLTAAERVFGTIGYERASIAEITREAGVALGTFYVYFPSKEAVLVELVDELSARLRRFIAERVAGVENRLEVEREGFRAFFDFCAEHRNLYRIIRQAEFVDEAAFRRYYRTLAKGYQRGLTVAMKKGEVRALDPEVLAYALMGVADFLGMRFVLWGDGKRFDAVVDQITEFLVHGLNPDLTLATAGKPQRRKS